MRANTRPRPYTYTSTRMHARTNTCTHAHREVFNTYCFSTVTIVTRRRLNVTLYVHCLSCSDITSRVPWDCACSGTRRSCSHVWLIQIDAFVFSNLYLVFLYVFITFACWAFTTLILYDPYIMCWKIRNLFLNQLCNCSKNNFRMLNT